MKTIFKRGRKVNLNPPKWWKFGKWTQKIFGNADSPEPNINYRYKSRWHWLFIRNPLHNLMFYGIGISNKDRRLKGIEPDEHFIDGRFNWIVSYVGNKKYPYISYQKTFKKWRFQFYLGWRPSGAFGFKCRFFRHRRK